MSLSRCNLFFLWVWCTSKWSCMLLTISFLLSESFCLTSQGPPRGLLASYAGVSVSFCSTPAPWCCPPLRCPPAFGLKLPLSPGGLQHQSIAQTNNCCSTVLVRSSSWVLFSVWFCPNNFCTVQFPLLQTVLLHAWKFSVNSLRFPYPPVP